MSKTPDIQKMRDTLKNLGIDINKISRKKMASLVKIAGNISDPANMTTEQIQQISQSSIGREILEKVGGEAIGPKPTPKQSTKIKRNGPCPCKSGKKYKKCCLIKDLSEVK